MARTPRRESVEQQHGLPLYRGMAPPRQEPDPTGWSSNEEEAFEDEDEDEEDEEDLEETEHEILLDDDFSDVRESTDDEDQL